MSEQIEELIKEVKLTNKLLIHLAFRENKLNDNIELLDKMGLPPKDIAFYLNTTRNTISVQKNKINKGGNKNVKRK